MNMSNRSLVARSPYIHCLRIICKVNTFTGKNISCKLPEAEGDPVPLTLGDLGGGVTGISSGVVGDLG